MHIRVLLSKYRSYTPCGTCGGARLKTDALLWRWVEGLADAVLGPSKRFLPAGVGWTRASSRPCRACSLHDLMLLPIDALRDFFDGLALPAAAGRAAELLLGEIRTA
jgi:excinuclease ABC subunit A